ncbi:MAG: DUF21 domain-containing protein [Elusimicrobia bacterium]|nr:DUF21 domain-containing protein [Elusimicrobiota bacterium]
MILFFWLVSAFFLAVVNFAESAITSLSVARLKGLKALDGGPYWKAAHRWLRHPEEYLTILLLLNNLFEVALTAVLLTGLERWLGIPFWREAVAWLAGGMINLVALTIYPKILGRQFARGMAGAWILQALFLVIAPLYPFLRFFFWAVARLSGSGASGALGREISLSLEELRELVEAARVRPSDRGSFRGDQTVPLDIEHRAMDMAANYLRLRDITVEQIMTPRDQVSWIDWEQFQAAPEGSPQRQRLEFALMTDGHTRTMALSAGLPVGYIHAKDLLIGLSYSPEAISLESLYHGGLKIRLRPILAFHRHQTLLEALPLLLRDRPLAYVVSGSEWLGIVSAEDLLEEITGEIVDEFEPRKKTVRGQIPAVHLGSPSGNRP